MTTATSICNRALLKIGAKPIASLDEESDRARVCSVLYTPLRDGLLAGYDWRFTILKAKLTRDAAAPATEWRYQFLLPPGRLHDGAVAVFDTNGFNAEPITDWERFADRIQTNCAEIWCEYQVARTEAELPPYFIDLLVEALCSEIAMPITDQQSTATAHHQKAYGVPSENMRGGLFGQAMLRDSQGNASPVVNSDDLEVARFS
jgi:hypothetical protein